MIDAPTSKVLFCHIVNRHLDGVEFILFDGTEPVAYGVSLDKNWVGVDAYGAQTKPMLDIKYPEGWIVQFAF